MALICVSGRISQWNHLVLDLFFAGRIFIFTNLISVPVKFISLFKLSFLFSFGRLCVSRNLSSSSRLCTLCWHVIVSGIFTLVLLCCAIFVVISLVLFLLFWGRSSLFLKFLVRDLLILFILQRTSSGFIDIFIKNPLFIYSLTFIISFLSIFRFICFCCVILFRWQVVFLICDFSEKVCIAVTSLCFGCIP